MEINRAISMCDWTMTVLVSLDIGTHVTNKLITVIGIMI